MKFYLKTYGCKMNQADSEIIKGMLSEKHEEVSKEEADFVILNTCGVVEKTERKILKEARELKKQGKKVIISGCLPLISRKECLEVSDGIINPRGIGLINSIIEKTIKKGKDKEELLLLKKRSTHSTSAVISIAEGCLGSCTYCATRLARKELKSFQIKNIINEAKQVISQGFKEIQLTSQDLGIYGLDKGKQLLPNLLKELIKIKGNFRIKLGMMNPGHTRKIIDKLIPLYESEKIYKFIHLPLQTGDNELLKKLNRKYLVEDFEYICKLFRKTFKDNIIATDIIVGHPLETEKSFEKTLKAIKKIKPDIIHIFKFSKRKGTPDFNLKDYPDRIKKERSRKLNNLFQEMNMKKNKRLIGKKYKVLVIEKRKGKYLGRTDSGRAIVINNGKIGSFVDVKIDGFEWNYLTSR
ncbi:MAG: tRNA (N(6)-L-threonylcarbamoyladenosine(37)-C(2))-methylthiotransferase [Candidatus Pacebacteria bacterium]|nr:tRNA (N(6)-L-threonylcarbamoyladenosine(37)-C(2))-methylthiotransferase [Candidatus Paceibacterota bacterium]